MFDARCSIDDITDDSIFELRIAANAAGKYFAGMNANTDTDGIFFRSASLFVEGCNFL